MIVASIVALLAANAVVAGQPKEPAQGAKAPDTLIITAAVPPPPAPPPPFSDGVRATAAFIDAQVLDEFKRCGEARANSNGRYVDAMGTRRHSAEWEKATHAMDNGLTVCRNLRQALRREQDFLLDLIQNGTTADAVAARARLDSVSSELEALEQFFGTETLKYRELLVAGWGNPHCIERPLTGFETPSSLCPTDSLSQQKR